MGKERLADGKGTVGRWERNGLQMGKERLADGKGAVGRWERNGWQMEKERLTDGKVTVRHVTGNDKDYLRKIPRVVV